ncbi:S-layer homology domain-containing protein [Paenibacillus sp. 1P07SE]|uniref:Kelch repeat-containing protein n=1 Tax=Paenibacillus sp. 1P07SE TaxID=3132209 RepID=UPI0039A4DA49
MGGRYGSQPTQVSDEVWEYDRTNTATPWKQKASIPDDGSGGRDSYNAAVIDDKIYIFGGRGIGYMPSNTIMSFDPKENEWERKQATVDAHMLYRASAVSGGKVYFFGGELLSGAGSNAKSSVVSVYDPKSDTYEDLTIQTQANWTARSKVSATALTDGRILLIGGLEEGGPTNAVTIYNPIKNTMAAAFDLPVALHSAYTFTQKAGQDIIILTGGVNGSEDYTTNVYATGFIPQQFLDLNQVGIDVARGELTNTTTAMQYSLEGGASGTWSNAVANNTPVTFEPGMEISVREAADHSHIRTVGTIAPPADAPTVTADTSAGLIAVKLNGATTEMEYSLLGGVSDWIPVSAAIADGTETIDASGENHDLRVRIAVTAAALPSHATDKLNVLVPAGPLDLSQVGIDVANDVLTNTATEMEYSLNGGVDWALAEGGQTVVDFQPGMIYVREAADPLNNRHVATIAPPGAAPAVTADTSAGLDAVKLIGATSDMDYTVNGTKWHRLTPAMAGGEDTIDASGENDVLQVRHGATAAALPSHPTGKLNVRHVPTPPVNNGYYPIYEAPQTPETPGQGGGNNVDIYVDGVKQDSLATARAEQAEGRTVTTVSVDTDKVLTKLQEQESKVITIPVTATEGDIITELSAPLFQALVEQQVQIELVTDRASYTLPAELIDLDEAARTLDAANGESDLTIAIRVAAADQATIGGVEAAAMRNQQTLITQPIAFQVTISSGEKSLEITEFAKYVERSIALAEDVDSSRITTGVVLGEDGELYHVPTTIRMKDGKYYAHIKSLSNSVYAVVWNPEEFTDLEQHWSREEATDMAARMIVPGLTETAFAPHEKVARAEFAVMTVRALGLQPAGPGEPLWTDMSAADRWEADLRTAHAYGIARGDEKGSFHPHQTITRAEASSILARALEVAGLEGSVSSAEAATLLASFKDGGEVDGWAAGHIGAAIQAGILHGDNDMIRPLQEVNRAQAAAMLRRLLVAAELIND